MACACANVSDQRTTMPTKRTTGWAGHVQSWHVYCERTAMTKASGLGALKSLGTEPHWNVCRETEKMTPERAATGMSCHRGW